MKVSSVLKTGFVISTILGTALTGLPNVLAGEYTDKSVHDSGDVNTYKHPKQRSFTSPFDYSPVNAPNHVISSPPPTTPELYWLLPAEMLS